MLWTNVIGWTKTKGKGQLWINTFQKKRYKYCRPQNPDVSEVLSENNDKCSWCWVFMFTSHFYTFIGLSQRRLSPKNTLLCLNTRHWSKGQCNSSLSDATYAYNFSPYLLPCLFYFIFLFHFVPMKWDVSADTSFLRGQTKCVNPDAFFWTRTFRLFFSSFSQ